MNQSEKIIAERDELIASVKTIQLATVSDGGDLEASYAPFRRSPDGAFDILVSTVAPHGRNLLSGRAASALLIEDEASAKNLFARRRLSLEVVPGEVDRADPAFGEAVADLGARCGDTADHLAGMNDFHLVRLVPKRGRLVVGFGRAYALEGPGLEPEGQIRAKHNAEAPDSRNA